MGPLSGVHDRATVVPDCGAASFVFPLPCGGAQAVFVGLLGRPRPERVQPAREVVTVRG